MQGDKQSTHLEETGTLKQLREGNKKGSKRFSELLDTIVVSLTKVNQEAELGNRVLYISPAWVKEGSSCKIQTIGLQWAQDWEC